MGDNILKKEFGKKDVERLRNLIKGKASEKTGAGIGYTKKLQFHNEGDVWVEDDRKWTIKDGIKENITKLDEFKNTSVPLFCPECNIIMNKQLDLHYYRAHKKCINCVTKFETQLKLDGKWEDHIKKANNDEIDQIIKEYKSFMKDKLSESNGGFVTESGEVEKWIGGINLERAEDALEEGIKYLESLKN